MIRISITGPESTGKSALSKQLAERFQGIYIPEFAREYLELNGPSYTKETVEFIAERQLELQNKQFKEGLNLVVFDTDLYVCQVWMEHVFGDCPAWLLKAAAHQNFDLTLLMQVDLPWEEDPLREHPRERNFLFDKYQDILIKSAQKFEIVSGIGENRFENASEKINQHFGGLLKQKRN